MIWVFPDIACQLSTYQNLIFSNWVIALDHEIPKEAQQDGFLLSLQMQWVNQLDSFFEQRMKIVVDQVIAVSKDLTNKLPSMHTILHIIHE